MKQKVTIEVEFEKNYELKDEDKFIVIKEYVLKAWKDVIVYALDARLAACKTNLYDNRDRVTYVDDNRIEYKTEKGRVCSYNIRTADGITDLIARLQKGEYKQVSFADAIQMLKALYWVPMDQRKNRMNISFDDLYSILLNYATYIDQQQTA